MIFWLFVFCIWCGSYLFFHEGFVRGYSFCSVWGEMIACQHFLGGNVAVSSLKLGDLLAPI